MIYLLDANTCINFLNGRSENIRQRLEDEQPENIALCSIVQAELLYGAFKSARPLKNLERLRVFFESFVSFPFDNTATEAYGTIRARLEQAGTPIGPNDLFIAAIAVSRQATLVTSNTREFARVQDLLLEDWS
jgi:tRNA(fMet)-specific endonuclease VapC